MDNGSEVNVERISKVKRIVRYSVAIAASVLLIVVCIVVYNFYQLSSDRLFTENYTAYELTTFVGEKDSTASKIEKAYRKKNYALKDTTEYYMALAYLKNNDYDQAIELMNAIHDNSSHLYSKKFSRKYINKIKRLKWR